MNKRIVVILFVVLVALSISFLIYNNKQLNDEIQNLKSSNALLNITINDQKDKIEDLKELKENDSNTRISLGEGDYEDLIIENGTPISKERAKEIVDDYRKNVLLDNNDSLKFVEITEEKIKCENKYILIENKYILDRISENDIGTLLLNNKKVQKNVYAVYYASDGELEKMTGYVDMYTGELLGVYQEGI